VAEELERQLVAETLPEALGQAALRPVAEPAIEARPPVGDAPFRYSARIEIEPEVELGEVRGLPGRRPAAEVSDADVLSELEALRQRHARLLEEPPERAIEHGHVVTIDFVGRVDGRPFEGGSGKDVELEVGSGRFVPGFEEQLVGARAGDDLEVRVDFPADYRNEGLAGKQAVFATHVASVRRREVPELDDEFAKDVGEFGSLEALRARVREELRQARERHATQELHRSLLDALIARTSFEVPPGLRERRLRSRLAGARRQLEQSVPHEALDAQLAHWAEEWRPQAEREVREALLLAAVAEREGIEVTDAEVDARIDALAAAQRVEPARLRKVYREQELLGSLRAQMREEKALEFLVREAKVETISGS
jgi:trigger factor